MPTDRRAIAVPMLDARGLRAVAYASSSRFDAPIDEESVVRTVAHATMPYAIALEREADRVDATHDGLTGLLGARAFRRLLHDELARDRGRTMMSVWFVDTDRFKDVNDRFGHRAGDGVLQAMAALLRSHLVAGRDAGARNGGDEFCALLRETGKATAIERARAFCEAVRSFDFGVDVALTASVGVATFPHDAASSSALLEVADAAMYHSKRQGRDRVSYALAAGSYASA
jgi:diguanylate cyclase (GGDEF)-like protein